MCGVWCVVRLLSVGWYPEEGLGKGREALDLGWLGWDQMWRLGALV